MCMYIYIYVYTVYIILCWWFLPQIVNLKRLNPNVLATLYLFTNLKKTLFWHSHPYYPWFTATLKWDACDSKKMSWLCTVLYGLCHIFACWPVHVCGCLHTNGPVCKAHKLKNMWTCDDICSLVSGMPRAFVMILREASMFKSSG